MNGKNLLILDKDRTCTETISGENFPKTPEDQKLADGVKLKVHRLLRKGWHIALASNQGGVAAGKKSLKFALDEMHFALRLLGFDSSHLVAAMIAHSYENVKPEAYLIILDGPSYSKVYLNGNHAFRKPGDGMLRRLGKIDTDEQYSRIVMVGDRMEDKTAAYLAGVEFQWADGWEIEA